MDGQDAFYLVLVFGTVWMVYMATWRPEQWKDLCRENRERNLSMLSGGLKIGRVLYRAYRIRR